MSNNKFVLIPVDLLKNILETREVIENQEITKLPKKAHVRHLIDGDMERMCQYN